MYISFYGENSSDLSDLDISQLQKLEYIVLHGDNGCQLNQNNNELRYLFSNKTSLHKRKWYFNELNKVNFTCSICSKPYSFHISPKIDEDGNVNFKEVVCVCKDCRTKKLKKRDILVPQFKQPINWREECIKINKEIKEKGITQIRNYKILRKYQIKIEKFIKVILPPLPKEPILSEYMIDMRKELEEMGEIDLSVYKNRKKVRKYLHEECGGICPCCGSKSEILTIDHIVAKSIGGKNVISNFIGLCGKCNIKKDDMDVLDFISQVELRFLSYNILKEAHRQQDYWKTHLVDLIKEIETIK